jgi:hypothetical protein
MHRDNRTGVKGVTRCKRDDRWIAQIFAEGRNRFLGRFDTIEEAAAAYAAASLKFHGEFGVTAS